MLQKYKKKSEPNVISVLIRVNQLRKWATAQLFPCITTRYLDDL